MKSAHDTFLAPRSRVGAAPGRANWQRDATASVVNDAPGPTNAAVNAIRCGADRCRAVAERPLVACTRHDTVALMRYLTRRCSALFAAVVLTAVVFRSIGVMAAEGEQEAARERSSFPVAVRIDAGKGKGELRPFCRFFGADEPNYAYMKDGKKLLAELGELRPGEVYFRTHNLLNSGDGTPALKWGSTGAYSEDADGNPRYDWSIVYRNFATYLERGVRPYVQIGFMPNELSIRPELYQQDWTPRARYEKIYTGWSFPPKGPRKNNF